MSYAVDTPASPSRLQVQTEKDRKMTVTSGLKCYELSKLQGQDSLLEKMLLVTSPWASTMCYLTWKQKTTPQGRLLFQLAPKMRNIDETEFGLWATPNTMDHLPQRTEEAMQRLKEGHRKGRSKPSNLREQVSPQVMKFWRTPDTGQGGTSGLLKQGKTHRENGQPIQVRLVDQVNNPKLWPTPTTQDAKNNGGQSQHERNSKPLNAEVGGSLNPQWVEWLMGYPTGWTDLEV